MVGKRKIPAPAQNLYPTVVILAYITVTSHTAQIKTKKKSGDVFQ
jgi:hypothetical protein